MPGTYPRRAARLVGSKLLLLFQESRNEGNRVIPKSYAQIQEGAGRCALPALRSGSMARIPRRGATYLTIPVR